MGRMEKNEKEHHGLTQGSQIFANCQEEVTASQAQHKDVQHEK